jgi:4-aminobutyrate aminotransferase-like enzyme
MIAMARPETMINAFVPGQVPLPPETEALVARRQAVLGPAYRLFYQEPLHLVRGEDVWLYDADGNAYLDAYNNVASVGHCHPHVVAAMSVQAGILATHTRYLHDAVLSYAERLLSHFPSEISQAMFTCTGSEANDLALRLARAATGGTGVIVTETAYHGVTLSVAEFSPSLGPGVALGTHVRTVPAPLGADAAAFGTYVQAAIDDLVRHGIKPAVLIVDTIFSSDGVSAGPAGFLAPAVDAIHAAGGLFIADEVQPGFGRTGDAMWGFQRHGVLPDMVSMGKPMGNGYPVAGLVMQPAVIEAFGAKARYFNTFGGNAVAMATASAVLDVIEDQALMQNAASTGAMFAKGLEELSRRHTCLGEVRAAGLFLAVDVLDAKGAPDRAGAARIVNDLARKRVLISASGKHGHSLKIRPPLTFGPAHVEMALSRLDEVLAQ